MKQSDVDELEPDEVLLLLRELNESDAMGFTTWEVNFLESVCSQTYPLTAKQLESAKKLIRNHY